MFFAAREAMRVKFAEREREKVEAAKREANRISNLVSSEVTRQLSQRQAPAETLTSARQAGRREERERIIRVLAQHGIPLTPELTISLIDESG